MNLKYVRIGEDARPPERASNGAVGYDVYAYRVLDKKTKEPIAELPVTIQAGSSVLIGIGVLMAVPWPTKCEVLPRSGLAVKYDIELSNSPGTVDPDFRGEIGILLRNRGSEPFVVEKGMRIAQLSFVEAKVPIFEEAKELPPTFRGADGFGSTGLYGIQEGTGAYQQAIRDIDQFYMKIVLAVAERSNCVRGAKRDEQGNYMQDEFGKLVGQTRKFGCVIVKEDNIVSTGYNAQHKGSPLCSKVGCLRDAEKIPSGTRIERCRAVHAEWWAFSKLAVSGVGSTKGATIYLNAEPCEVCAKLIAQTEIETMVLLEGVYMNNGVNIIKDAGINIRYIKL
jgi:deoxyuridine 5'-triphosphate nucleotidohydrolase